MCDIRHETMAAGKTATAQSNDKSAQLQNPISKPITTLENLKSQRDYVIKELGILQAKIDFIEQNNSFQYKLNIYNNIGRNLDY